MMLPASVTSLFCRLLVVSRGETTINVLPSPAGLCTFCCPIDLDRDIQYLLYTRKNPTLAQVIKYKDAKSLRRSLFNSFEPTVIYIHGYSEGAPGHSANAIRDAYLRRGDFNVILVNWSRLAALPWYNVAVQNTRSVGAHVARMASWLDASGAVSLSRLHVIGFSLGAEVAGFMGKAINRHRKKLGRITGLDAAYPLYMYTGEDGHLAASDASFVDVIHTDGGHFGFPNSIGHADFFPNGGRPPQPGCGLENIVFKSFSRLINQHIACSHNRAWKLYAESVTNPYGFIAVRYPRRCQRVRQEKCDCESLAFMGFAANHLRKGKFYLKTNSRPPFATNMSFC